ncbi:hypothetical protein JQ594_36340 [Bradyrhizobium manausense]|uniref:hypothetical protein n=1 Tax=Bradyrhizobium manausense TaxID=989370 RepID=UPI001BA5D809|nr:hypothetical protein [Bradyrhizobium manausense]MBR0691431.1 hypothetical protein [Bradyrhizobium manausense]
MAPDNPRGTTEALKFTIELDLSSKPFFTIACGFVGCQQHELIHAKIPRLIPLVRQAASDRDFEVGNARFDAAHRTVIVQISGKIAKAQVRAPLDFIEVGGNLFKRLSKASQMGDLQYRLAH